LIGVYFEAGVLRLFKG